VSIPPAFNQLSFFAVQPGESFHDVEEVIASDNNGDAEDESRVRMAISGWYHIPQEGEEGYIEGLESEIKSAEKSSLAQLQGKGDCYDLPAAKTQPINISSSFDSSTDPGEGKPLVITDSSFSEDDLNFLLKYLAPSYLTPDTLESVADIFGEQCSLTLEGFLSEKFANSLREYIVIQESQALPASTKEIESTTPWTVARPPHKHRFLFQQSRGEKNIKEQSPLQDLLENLLPSVPFYKWLQLATGQVISSHNLLARRFRRGNDYTLATGYEEEDSRLEITLAITPSSGWEAETPSIEPNVEAKEHTGGEAKEHIGGGGGDVGGYVAYMGGEEDGEDEEREVPADGPVKRPQSDPAVYQAPAEDEDDDSILFSMPAAWNRLGIVLRDKGVMRFVKYVSRQARGDRWDICGEFSVVPPAEGEEEEEGEGEEEKVHRTDEARGRKAPDPLSPVDDTDESEPETETSDDD
jgi:hypothetical protein